MISWSHTNSSCPPLCSTTQAFSLPYRLPFIPLLLAWQVTLLSFSCTHCLLLTSSVCKPIRHSQLSITWIHLSLARVVQPSRLFPHSSIYQSQSEEGPKRWPWMSSRYAPCPAELSITPCFCVKIITFFLPCRTAAMWRYIRRFGWEIH